MGNQIIREGYNVGVTRDGRQIYHDQIFIRVIIDGSTYYRSVLAPKGQNIVRRLFERLDTLWIVWPLFTQWYNRKYGPVAQPIIGNTYVNQPISDSSRPALTIIDATEENIHTPMYFNDLRYVVEEEFMREMIADMNIKGYDIMDVVRTFLNENQDIIKIVDASNYKLPDQMQQYIVFDDEPATVSRPRASRDTKFEAEINIFIESRPSITDIQMENITQKMNLSTEDIRYIVGKVANSPRVLKSHTTITNLMGKGVWVVRLQEMDLSDLREDSSLLAQAVFIPQDSIKQHLGINDVVPDYNPRQKGYVLIVRSLDVPFGPVINHNIYTTMVEFIVGRGR